MSLKATPKSCVFQFTFQLHQRGGHKTAVVTAMFNPKRFCDDHINPTQFNLK